MNPQPHRIKRSNKTMQVKKDKTANLLENKIHLLSIQLNANRTLKKVMATEQ